MQKEKLLSLVLVITFTLTFILTTNPFKSRPDNKTVSSKDQIQVEELDPVAIETTSASEIEDNDKTTDNKRDTEDSSGENPAANPNNTNFSNILETEESTNSIDTNNIPTDPIQTEVVQEPVEDQIIVKLEETTTEEQKEEYIASLGTVEVEEIEAINSLVINYSESELNSDQVIEAEIVETSEQDFFASELGTTPNDPDYRYQWVFKKYDVVNTWATQEDEIIAVVDSGICFNHPDLQGRILQGYDFVNDDPIAEDQRGHGCAVSGIIAANTNNNAGVAGMHSKAKILPVKVLNSSGTGSYSDIAQGIIYSTDHGADVINLSLGGTGNPYFLKNAVDYATSKGVVVVAAAGNSNQEGALYPAKYENVIAVGAINDRLEKSAFSNYGVDIDVWAPGEKIYTTTWDNKYINKSGTSYAAPHVSALGSTFFKNRTEPVNNEPAPFVVKPAPIKPDQIALSEINEQFTKFQGWTVEANSNFQVKHVNSMLRIETNSSTNTQGSVKISSEFIKLVTNKNYYLSTSIQTANAKAGKVSLNLYDQNFNLIGTAKTISNDITSKTLAEYSITYYIPQEFNGKTVKYAKLVLEANGKLDTGNSITGLTLFDNVYISTTPK